MRTLLRDDDKIASIRCHLEQSIGGSHARAAVGFGVEQRLRADGCASVARVPAEWAVLHLPIWFGAKWPGYGGWAREEGFYRARNDAEPSVSHLTSLEVGEHHPIVRRDPPSLGSYVLPGNNYHVYDYPLFWANVRADVARRLDAFEAR